MIHKPYKQRSLQLHILCWGLFITYEILVAFSFSNQLSPFFDYAGHYFLNIGLFYLNVVFVFKKIAQRKKNSLVLLLCVIILEFIIYMILKNMLYQILIFFSIYKQTHIPTMYVLVIQSLWRFIYFIGLSTGYWFAVSKIRQNEIILDLETDRLKNILEKEAMEKSLLEAENRYLKAQINPHFLFNILGLIHNQVYKVSSASGEIITILADMMRYALNRSHPNEYVDLLSEIDHINNYIAINQYRFGSKLCLNFDYRGDLANVQIIPLLLVTLVENVFKYADLFTASQPALISLNVADDELHFFVQNKKAQNLHSHGHGLGMSNLSRRLEQHYKNKFSLTTDNQFNQYVLNLKISLK